MGFNYKYVELPTPPQYLLDICVSNVINNINEFELKKNTIIDKPLDGYVHSPLNEAYAQVDQNYQGGVYHTPPQLLKWLQDNMPIDTSNCWVAAFKKGKCCIPHVDKLNKIAFNILLTDSNATTCWYNIKKDYNHLKFPEFGQFAQFLYTRLDLIESTTIQKNKWHIIRTDLPHSVENLNDELRVLLRIGSVDKDLFYKF